MFALPIYELDEPMIVLDLGLDFGNKQITSISAIKLYPSIGNDMDYYRTNSITKTTLEAFFDWTEGAAVAMYEMQKQLNALYASLKLHGVIPSCKPAWRFDIIQLVLRSYKSSFPNGYEIEQIARYLEIDTNITDNYTRTHMITCILLELMARNSKKFQSMGFKAGMQKDIQLIWMPIGPGKGQRMIDLSEYDLEYGLLSSNADNRNLPELHSSIKSVLAQCN